MTVRSQAELTIRDRFQQLVPQMILLHERVAKEMGLSAVALQALHLIDLHDGPISPTELSKSSGLPRSTVARVLAALESDGYVRRTEVPGDGRRALISSAPKARTVGTRFDLYADAMRAVSADFSATELAVIARYWDALLQAVEDRAADN
ncbi:MarR family winged helix-turn-helix transcriptional regulator [Microlunatus soli]|uniref:DNA-binding transcriptional regulator, MarR family n=1 Tax=Microlunatus soli TaxID=630515 RepID=A0A1H1RZX8_9ACTN|nr:MarR family transcriptional regulator [Microlunatus soli]SDS41235.1 DNA-binding transcriptional regulator, MarR family [Microlunatus soli]